MWNYEAVIKETNDKLIADRNEPLYAVYPEDAYRSATRHSALSIADAARRSRPSSPTCRASAQERNPGADRSDRTAVELGRAALLKADATTNLDPSRPLTVVRRRSPPSFKRRWRSIRKRSADRH